MYKIILPILAFVNITILFWLHGFDFETRGTLAFNYWLVTVISTTISYFFGKMLDEIYKEDNTTTTTWVDR